MHLVCKNEKENEKENEKQHIHRIFPSLNTIKCLFVVGTEKDFCIVSPTRWSENINTHLQDFSWASEFPSKFLIYSDLLSKNLEILVFINHRDLPRAETFCFLYFSSYKMWGSPVKFQSPGEQHPNRLSNEANPSFPTQPGQGKTQNSTCVVPPMAAEKQIWVKQSRCWRQERGFPFPSLTIHRFLMPEEEKLPNFQHEGTWESFMSCQPDIDF